MKYPIKIISTIYIFISIITVQCSKPVIKPQIVTPYLDRTIASETDESYESLKAKWTVTLNPVKPDASSPAGIGGPGRRGGGRFPLAVSASLMDAKVIEAGFDYYTNLLTMTTEEREAFRQRYVDLHNTEKYILIEATLQTSWTEIYLDLNRWTIFLEDNKGNQHEPEKISEQSIPTLDTDNTFINPPIGQLNAFPFQFHQKQIFLYFPRNDSYGQPIIHKGIEYLKIVFIQEEGFPARAEGTWAFSWNNERF